MIENTALNGALAMRGALDLAERHRSRVLQCALLVRLAADIPTREILSAIAIAESAAPVVDPTLWKAKHAAMMEDKALVEAVHVAAEFGRALGRRAAEGAAALPGEPS